MAELSVCLSWSSGLWEQDEKKIIWKVAEKWHAAGKNCPFCD
jgi:hypothetical protein